MTSSDRHAGASRSPPTPGGSPALSSEPARSAASTSPVRILLVEDEFLIAMSIEGDLREGGYDVVGTAHSADDAVAMAKAERPDLILMDVRLVGNRDGIDAAIEIYEATGIRSIFATAHGDPETVTRSRPAAPLGWVHKPYGRDNLLSAVEEGLRILEPPSRI
jgi:DNA-binding NarL/FixJ family response regulator